MNFEEFWDELIELLDTKSEFETDRKIPFVAKRGMGSVVIMPESSDNKYEISKEEFGDIWRLAEEQIMSGTYNLGDYTKDTRRASYILTLMEEVLEKQDT